MVEHVSGTVVFDEEVTRLGTEGTAGSRSSTPRASRSASTSRNRIAQTFDTRSDEHVAPLLDSIEEVLAALHEAGVEAFPAYGTLLGAVREQH